MSQWVVKVRGTKSRSVVMVVEMVKLDVEGRLLVVVVVVVVGRTSALRFEGVKVMTPDSEFAPCCKVGVLGA
jgi:hypothetical protein